MIETYLNQDGYRVTKGTWTLYSDVSAATITLTGTLPSVSFRCRVKISSAAGHTDVAGHVLINSEDLTFIAAGTKTSTILLTALPTVTTTELNCQILIEAIDSGGAPISLDTQTALDCRFQDTQKSFRLPSGEFSTSQAIAYTDDSSCAIGTLFSYGGYDYSIAQVSVMTGLDGSEEGRKLYLTGKTLAPATRAVATNIPGTVASSDVMLKSVYDTDADGISDKAEGIPVLDTVPSDLSGYADGDMFKVGRRTYVVDKS